MVLWSVKSKVEFFSEIMAAVFSETTGRNAFAHVAWAMSTVRKIHRNNLLEASHTGKWRVFHMHIPAWNSRVTPKKKEEEKKKKIKS